MKKSWLDCRFSSLLWLLSHHGDPFEDIICWNFPSMQPSAWTPWVLCNRTHRTDHWKGNTSSPVISPLGIASSGFPIPDFSGPEGLFPDSGSFNSRSGNREMPFLSYFINEIVQFRKNKVKKLLKRSHCFSWYCFLALITLGIKVCFKRIQFRPIFSRDR